MKDSKKRTFYPVTKGMNCGQLIKSESCEALTNTASHSSYITTLTHVIILSLQPTYSLLLICFL